MRSPDATRPRPTPHRGGLEKTTGSATGTDDSSATVLRFRRPDPFARLRSYDRALEQALDAVANATGSFWRSGARDLAHLAASTHRVLHACRTPRGRWTGPIARRTSERQGVRS